jgi:hypothetical protein
MEPGGLRRYIQGMAPGDYEVTSCGREGLCAACLTYVMPTHNSVIRYSELPNERGGIFHTRCAPTGPQWFGVEGE